MTISGSISGVSPTATDTPNSRACSQSPPAMPVTSMDTGTVTAVNAISIQDVEFMPRSKRVRGRCHWNARDSPPNSALRPVAMTTANAEPEITVVPVSDQTGRHHHEQDDARGHRRAGMVLPP